MDPVLSRLEALCAKREYCSSDILAKALKLCEGDSVRAQEYVRKLISDGFVCDARYAAAFAREKSAITGWGPVKIRFALAAKKISREDIDKGLSEIDSASASEKLSKLLEAKWKTLKDDPQGRLKLLRFALGRGFEYDTVQCFVREISKVES